MAASEIENNFTPVLDKTQVKLFFNFTTIPLDELFISWMTNYANNL